MVRYEREVNHTLLSGFLWNCAANQGLSHMYLLVLASAVGQVQYTTEITLPDKRSAKWQKKLSQTLKRTCIQENKRPNVQTHKR